MNFKKVERKCIIMQMNNEILMQKKMLRRKMIDWRETITNENRLKWCKLISEHVISMPEFVSANCIAGYISFKAEVDVANILHTAIESGKKVVLPVTDPQNHRMFFREVNDLGSLITGGYGIQEPPSENSVISFNEIDLVIIPGVAFSRHGDRLGYGGGYYDSVLNKWKSLKVAVAFDGQVIDDIPTDEDDVLMDYLITESGILKFSKISAK